ncbi:MAG: guanylate cyclase [Burkholderiales bacterium RIFCSPLOWO2_02_FULL_57_36]|nr:MAG: guanylate cyclase [Burkholderiales bacterium RIFCSPLOWO2_02_FULL_57_36]
MRQHVIRFALGLLILLVLLLHAGEIYKLSVISSLDQRLYDTKIQLTMPKTVDERLVILDIDEKSLAEIGRWPWGRDRMATLVNKLFDQYGIRALGFDVFLAEPDESSGLRVLEELGGNRLKNNQQYLATLTQLRPQLDYDKLFAKSLQGRPVILGYYFANEGSNSGAIPPPVLTGPALKGRDSAVFTWSNYGGILPQFQQVSMGAGYVNPDTESDGSVRRVPLLVKYDQNFYESFSLAMVRALLGSPDIVPGIDGADGSSSDGYGAIDWLDLPTTRGTMRIPVDGNMAALVPYRGYVKSYRYYSIADILADRIKPEQLQGRIALVGTSAPGLTDERTTPVGKVYPGVEVHANLITGMLDNTIKLKPQYAVAVEFIFLLLVGGLMIFLFPWRSPLRATLATLLVLVAVLGTNLGLWQYANWVQPLAASLLLVSGLFVLNMSYGYFVESRAKRQFTELFGQYVPPELVEEMSRNPQSYSMAGRKAELTVLFSDIRGFTAMSERMEPDQLAYLMNEYLSAMTLVIRRHRGTLDKYIGDAIMAFWGAPVSDSGHARNAVVTALEMLQALVELNRNLITKGMPEIKIGIGINTGSMTVGDMGSVVRKAYTVMGDAVNLGSRLESITKQYGVGIIVGEATRRAVDDILFKELDLVQVVGKEEPVAIFEPLGRKGQLSEDALEELDLWNQLLQHYRKQAWQQADSVLDTLVQMQPDCRLYELYRERIAAFRKDAPNAAWAGVTRLDTK